MFISFCKTVVDKAETLHNYGSRTNLWEQPGSKTHTKIEFLRLVDELHDHRMPSEQKQEHMNTIRSVTSWATTTALCAMLHIALDDAPGLDDDGKDSNNGAPAESQCCSSSVNSDGFQSVRVVNPDRDGVVQSPEVTNVNL